MPSPVRGVGEVRFQHGPMVLLHQRYSCSATFRRALSAAGTLALGALVLCAATSRVQAQLAGAWEASPPASFSPSETASTTQPEPIYWKQNLFLIPYQWNTAADPSAAHAVWLYVSRDRGTTWQKISEAKPHVKAFNYHAEADGEYWFAIRTVDSSGQPRPAGPMLPELRVIVDTTMPQITELRGVLRADSQIDIQWSATDQNLDANSLRLEVQTEPSDEWHAAPTTFSAPAAYDTMTSRTTWSPPPGLRPMAVRATISDRAGNPAFFQTEVGATSSGSVARAPMPTLTAEPGAVPAAPYPQTNTWNPGYVLESPRTVPGGESEELVPAAPPLAAPPQASTGWTAPSAATPDPYGVSQSPSQPWAADVNAPGPFRLANSGQAADGGLANSATTYGNPVGAADRYAQSDTPDLVPVDAPKSSPDEQPDRDAAQGPAYSALQPFRQASISRTAGDGSHAPQNVEPTWSEETQSLFDRWGVELPRGVEPKFVNSRTFSLEYQVDDVGGWGVSKVQLWGTRDGGQTWHYYAEDDDNRSPLNVTVDGEGLYGFRIIVQSAAGPGGFAPQSGDLPELWVGIDMHRPQAELISVEPGTGNLSDHLILQWRADDDNLQPRPISLFYSSRPTGPWSAAATGLQNTGEYAWRLERYVPTQFYLRLEVRDTAGNLSAYQTVEPIRLDRPEPSGSLRAVEPVDPTASTPTTLPR